MLFNYASPKKWFWFDSRILFFLLSYFSILQLKGQSGALDFSFNPGTGTNNNWVNTIAVQSDGKILIGGDFTTYNGISQNRITRVNSDGSLDATFNTGSAANGIVWAITVQNDGKILVGGEFTQFNGTTANRIIRLNADGSIDNTFNVGTGYTVPGSPTQGFIRSIVIQPDGKILVGGFFLDFNGLAVKCITRLNADGSIDPLFNPGGSGISNYVYCIALQPDGKIVLGGNMAQYNGVALLPGNADKGVIRLNSNGSLDTGFNPGNGGSNGDIEAVAVQADGKILFGGLFGFYNGTYVNRLARLNADGTLDGTFATMAGTQTNQVLVGNRVSSIVVQPDNKILIGGQIDKYQGITYSNKLHICRLDENGNFEGFPSGASAGNALRVIALEPGGKILIGGAFTSYFSNYSLQTSRNRIARILGCPSLSTWYLDADNDGYYTSSQTGCYSPGTDWTTTAGISGDCDDNDPNTNANTVTWYLDADNDGYYVSTQSSCPNPGPGWTTTAGVSGDCDDNDPNTNINTITWYLDADNDGYYSTTQTSCANPGAGWTSIQGLSGDCNDNNASVNPGATDICENGVDDDCSGTDLTCSLTYSTLPYYPINLAIAPIQPILSPGLSINGGSFRTVTTFAGSGAAASSSSATNTSDPLTSTFLGNRGITKDALGNYYIAEQAGRRIRKISAGGIVTTIYQFSSFEPTDIAINTSNGDLYFTISSHRLCRIPNANAANYPVQEPSHTWTSDAFNVVVGASTSGTTNATGTSARLNTPTGLAISPDNSYILIADLGNNRIRKVMLSDFSVTTYSGSSSGSTNGPIASATYNGPEDICIINDNLIYVCESSADRVRKIENGTVSFFAGGTFTNGNFDGTGTNAFIDAPISATADALGNIYVVERFNHKVRKITPSGLVSTIAGSLWDNSFSGNVTGVGNNTRFSSPEGIFYDTDGGFLLVSDRGNNQIKKVQLEGFEILPTQTTGLSFNTATGDMTGTPTEYSLKTVYSQTFNSTPAGAATLGTVNGANVTLHNNAAIIGDYLMLTPRQNNMTGGITVPASGSNENTLRVSFDLSTTKSASTNGTSGAADGLSYSFAPDADATTNTSNSERGTGTKLSVSFANYYSGTGTNNRGIRIYWNPNSVSAWSSTTSATLLAYSNNTTWMGRSSKVTIHIDNDGKLTMRLDGTAIFTDVQLPADYVSSDKSNWKHVIKSRTGASDDLHVIDNLTIESGLGISNHTVIGRNHFFEQNTSMPVWVKDLGNDASLSNLVLSEGTLTPSFTPSDTSYSTVVTASSITVTPTATDPYSTITVNGASVQSGAASSPIALSLGNNTITVVVTSADGSTSTTYTINVQRNCQSTSNNTTTASACDSYTWSVNGQTYTTSTTATVVNGCTTEILNLTVTPSTSSTTTASACDSYSWSGNGQTYTQSGTYTAVNGCNTETLNLTITSSASNTTTASACDSYTWSVNGQTYTQSGTYNSVSGCNTETLTLTVIPSSTTASSITSCNSYTWPSNGQTYSQSGTFTYVNGCTTEQLNLTINSCSSNPAQWTGTVSNDWNNAQNWNPASVPLSGEDIVIGVTPNNPEIVTGVTVGSITLSSGASLIIDASGTITINGTLTNNGTIIIEEGASLVQTNGSTLTGNGVYTVNRTLPTANLFHFIGSPISNIAVNNFGITPAVFNGTNGSQLIPQQSCNPLQLESNSPWANILELRENASPINNCSQSLWHVKSTGNLTNGRGYSTMAYGNSAQGLSFSGTINNGDITYGSLGNSTGNIIDPLGGNITRGWHLVSNPYPSPITFGLSNNSLSNMGFDAQIQIWDAVNNVFIPSVNNTIIPVGQGFQIRNSGGSSLNFTTTNSMRTTTSATFYEMPWEQFTTITLENTQHAMQTVIFFHPEATDGYDNKMEANRLFGGTEVPVLYTITDGNEKMAFNGYAPLFNENKTVIMGIYDGGTPGLFSLRFQDLNTMQSTTVTLEDTKLNTFTQMNEGSVYPFTTETGDERNRFRVHFNMLNDAILVSQTPSLFTIFPNPVEESVTVTFSDEEQAYRIQLHDISGKIIMSREIPSGTKNLQLNTQTLASGIYLMEIISGSGERNGIKLIRK
jgi:uncharacterized delta-60 repeat protein